MNEQANTEDEAGSGAYEETPTGYRLTEAARVRRHDALYRRYLRRQARSNPYGQPFRPR